MRVVLSEKANQDIADLFEYISENLNNNIAAHNIVTKIVHLTQKLSVSPEMGASLSTVDPRLGRYRYLIADNYLIIYNATDEEVAVVRILYARSNYIQLLRG